MKTTRTGEIDALKIQIRRLKAITSVLILGLLLLMATAAVQTLGASTDNAFVHQIPAAVISAHDFTLIGKDGKPYGRLFTRGDQPALELYGKNGQVVWSAPEPATGIRPVEVNRR